MKACVTAVALALLAACTSKPDLDKIERVDEPHVAFSVPGNWSLERDVEAGIITTTTFTIEPADGIVLAYVFTPAVPVDAEWWLGETLKTMAAGLPAFDVGSLELLRMLDGTREPVTRTIDGEPRRGVRAHFVMTAVRERVPMTVEVYGLERDGVSAALLVQTADEDRPRDQPGIDLVLDSFRLR